MTRRTVVEREAARLAEELPLSDAERIYVAGSMRRVQRAARRAVLAVLKSERATWEARMDEAGIGRAWNVEGCARAVQALDEARRAIERKR